MFSHSFARLFRVAIGFAYTYRVSFEVNDAYNVVFLEFTPYLGDAYGEDTDCLVRGKYFCGAIVDVQLSFGESFAVGYPFFYAGYGLGGGDEAGVFQ